MVLLPWRLAVAAISGASVALLVVAWRGDGDIGSGGLIAALAAALLLLVLAILQLARPRSGNAGVLGGTASLLSATALVAAGGLLSQDAGGPRWLWASLLGGALAVGLLGLLAYVLGVGTTEGQPPTIEPGDVPDSVRGETVEVLLQAMQKLLDAEDTRAQSLNARATGLGGFAAVLVALLVPAAGDLGGGRGSEPLPASVILIATAAILLVAGVLAVLLGVVVTRQVSTVSITEVRLWETQAFVEKSPTWVRGRLLVTLRRALVTERLANNRKAGWLTAAVAVIAAGVLCAAVGSLTLLV